MAKRGSSRRPPRSTATVLLTMLLIVVAVIVSRLTGVDLLSTLGITTPAPTEIITVPTSPGAPPGVTSVPGGVTTISIPQGFGASKGFWSVFFTAPTGSNDESTFVGGIDTQLAADIAGVQRTLDIAAFEFNDEALTKAILDAKGRGVNIRMVADDESGVQDTKDTSFARFQQAGIPVVDDERGGFMHDKFMILDSTVVWTGSWNYTVNDTFRNNNNALRLRSQRAVQSYQAEFEEMFTRKEFGARSTKGNGANFTQDGVPIQILFGSEDPVVPAIISALDQAKSSIRFMAFSFTLRDVGDALKNKAAAGVTVEGIFELRGSETQFSQLTPLFCAGLSVRQDGNKDALHHKVFIIDDTTVITGSFNFSGSARDENDENLVIISDPDLAAQYKAEFARRWDEAVVPENLTCQ